jgi:hypothetical protein
MTFKIEEADVIFCSSKLTWKSAILFPARFLIQATTLSQYEHAAQFIDGKIAEANAKKGTILTPLQKWVNSKYDFVTIDVLRPQKITKKQLEVMLGHWVLTKGARYPFKKALYSSLDCLIPSSLKEPSLKREQFCSEGVLRALKKAALLPENLLARYYTPQELFELLEEVGFKHFENINPKLIYS